LLRAAEEYLKYEQHFFSAISQHNTEIFLRGKNKVAFTFDAALGVWGHLRLLWLFFQVQMKINLGGV
jgi:hypothetical protein